MEKQKRKVNITFIMPALNEEANIESALRGCLRAFSESHLDGEIVVVNDGSTDRTPEKVEEMMNHRGGGRVRMIHHPTPRGIGASFRDGLAEARGEVVTMMPGDDENEPDEIMRYLPLLREVDMVVPFVYNRGVRSPARNLLSALYRLIVNLTFGLNFNYTNGTVLYRRSILIGCENRSDGFFFQTENVVRAAKKGYLFAEVPYQLNVRGGGESKAVSFSSLKTVIKDYLNLVREIYFSRLSGVNKLTEDSVSARRRS